MPDLRQTPFWLLEQVSQARNWQEIPSLLISTVSLFSNPSEKPLEVCFYENVFGLSLNMYADLCTINAVMVATGSFQFLHIK